MSDEISYSASVFNGLIVPEKGCIVGYAAMIRKWELKIPYPAIISLVCDKNTKYQNENWQVFSSSYLPEDTLFKQIVFALKYEGINLLFFKKLFELLPKNSVEKLAKTDPTGQYSRKIWFLYEWLMNDLLEIENADLKIKYVNLLSDTLQYALGEGDKSPRHRIINNLPGTRDFCPIIRKTAKLEQYIASDLLAQNDENLKGIRRDVLLRTSAFLMLKDSKASFTIEGESPKSKRTARWAKAIGQAGAIDLSLEELIRLQQVVIENERFLEMGLRKTGGFVGEHDRISGEPIPEHISARWQDVEQLVNGLISTYHLQMQREINPIISAASIAFGFVFIHPFEDGNGRIHRYLIHHVLNKKQFSPQGIVFPVSASILNHIEDYRKVLESYAHPLLDFIDWKETKKHNVEVLNETIDFYRYFDATKQAEFLYDCVNDTIQHIIPQEISFLMNYDQFKQYLEDDFEMPDNTIALLFRFLEQNNGKLSKRARENEFISLTNQEVEEIEKNYELIFTNYE
jgi:Fic family protein